MYINIFLSSEFISFFKLRIVQLNRKNFFYIFKLFHVLFFPVVFLIQLSRKFTSYIFKSFCDLSVFNINLVRIKILHCRSPDSSSCSSRDPSPCARAPGGIPHAPIARRQSTTDEIFIARGFRRQSTTEETIRCRNFRRQSSQSEKMVGFLLIN